jgi:hypothetical protein
MARRIQKIKTTVTCNTTNNTIGTATTSSLSGYLVGIKVKSPAAVDSSATLTTGIKDDDGDALTLATGFTGQAANATVSQFADTQTQPNQLQRPLAGPLSLTCTLSATQSTTRNVTVTLYVDTLI